MVKPSQLDLPICDAFLAAAGEAGFPVVDDLNADVAEGFGRIDTNIENGRRASTAVAYVQPARRRGNLELLSGTIAARIVIEKTVERAGSRSSTMGCVRRDRSLRAISALAAADSSSGCFAAET